MDSKSIKSKIRTIEDWPKPGIMFRDITTLLKNPVGLRQSIGKLIERYKNYDFDLVAGIESRGFILGPILAYNLGKGFIPVRKKGKLPGETLQQQYSLEYGQDTIEIHKDALNKGQKVLLVDDLCATGGTALATIKLIESAGAKVIECCFVIDLPDLGGSRKLSKQGHKHFSLTQFDGE